MLSNMLSAAQNIVCEEFVYMWVDDMEISGKR